MSYLNQSFSENLATRLTNKGRQRIAEGNFNISYFQIGDSEYNYSGSTTLQKVLMPFDFDSQVKYPYLSSEYTYTGSTTGATYGSVVNMPSTNVVTTEHVLEIWDYDILSGNTGDFASAKAYFGYETFTGSSLGILHYSKMGITTGNTFKYEDYITYETDDYIENTSTPFFKIDSISAYYMSASGGTLPQYSGNTDVYPNRMIYKNLLRDLSGEIVGKVFPNQKVIIIENPTAITNVGLTKNIKMRTSINIEVMNMYVNLPSDYFKKSQNPTFSSSNTESDLMVTEIGLFNENRELLVISKCTEPIPRTGTQVFNVTLDI
jgi:hypothetical protein